MQRKYALVTAGFLTTAVMGAALTLSAFAASPSTTAAANRSTGQTLPAQQIKQQSQQNGKSVTWDQQVEQGKALFTALDTQAQPQIAAVKEQLSGLETDAATRLKHMQALQKEIEATQSAIQQDAQDYQNQMNQMQSLDAGWRQQVEEASNQLQAAYDALGQRQSGSSNGGNGGRFFGGERENEGESEGGN